MDREKITDEFSLPEEVPPVEKIQDGFVPNTVNTFIKRYSENSRGLHLPSHTGNNFFRPFIGKNPLHIFQSVRKINGKQFMFLDDEPPTDLNNLVKFIKRQVPYYTHFAQRKISKNITSIACQILDLMPEIREHSKVVLVRIQIPNEPTRIRYQILLK